MIESPLLRLFLLCSFGMALAAQSVPVLRPGELELTTIGGLNFGGSLSSVSISTGNSATGEVDLVTPSSNGSIGFRFAANITRRFLFTADWTYIAGGRINYTQDFYYAQAPLTTQRYAVDAHSSTMEFSGGGEYLFQLRRATHVIPLLLFGGTALRAAADLTDTEIGGPPGLSYSTRSRTYHAAINAGTGLRYYFGERIGFRIDGRIYKTRDLGTFGRVGFGVFYRFR